MKGRRSRAIFAAAMLLTMWALPALAEDRVTWEDLQGKIPAAESSLLTIEDYYGNPYCAGHKAARIRHPSLNFVPVIDVRAGRFERGKIRTIEWTLSGLQQGSGFNLRWWGLTDEVDPDRPEHLGLLSFDGFGAWGTETDYFSLHFGIFGYVEKEHPVTLGWVTGCEYRRVLGGGLTFSCGAMLNRIRENIAVDFLVFLAVLAVEPPSQDELDEMQFSSLGGIARLYASISLSVQPLELFAGMENLTVNTLDKPRDVIVGGFAGIRVWFY